MTPASLLALHRAAPQAPGRRVPRERRTASPLERPEERNTRDVASDRDDRRGSSAGSVALFIDWDNFAIGLRQEMPERAADVGPILRWARRFGSLTVCRAYGEWRDPAERLAIYNAGVEVVYAPVLPLGGSLLARNGGGAKSLADTAMAVDVTDLLNQMPGLTTVVLATSDKDLIPVLRFAQRRGLVSVVVGSDRTAAALKDLADDFISYRQLLEEGRRRAPALSRPTTVPPLRYPRGRPARRRPGPATPPRPGRPAGPGPATRRTSYRAAAAVDPGPRRGRRPCPCRRASRAPPGPSSPPGDGRRRRRRSRRPPEPRGGPGPRPRTETPQAGAAAARRRGAAAGAGAKWPPGAAESRRRDGRRAEVAAEVEARPSTPRPSLIARAPGWRRKSRRCAPETCRPAAEPAPVPAPGRRRRRAGRGALHRRPRRRRPLPSRWRRSAARR